MVCEACTAQFTGKQTDDSNAVPKSEPNVDVMKAIALKHIPTKYHTDSDMNPEDIKVKFLAEGAAHKVYKITHVGVEDWFVFRVAMPVNHISRPKTKQLHPSF